MLDACAQLHCWLKRVSLKGLLVVQRLLELTHDSSMSLYVTFLRKVVLPVASVVGLGWAANDSVFSVKEGERAVIFNRFNGVKQTTFGPGTHLKMPWADQPISFDVASHVRTFGFVTGSKDLHNLWVSLRVASRPDSAELPNIFLKFGGTGHEDIVLPSITKEIVKETVARHTKAQLLQDRGVLQREVSAAMGARAKTYHIVVEDVSLVEVQQADDSATRAH